MTLGLSTAQLNAAQGPHRVVAALIEMYFDAGTLRLCNFRWDIVIGADTYTHAPLLFPKQRESAGSTEGLQVSLNGLDPAVMAMLEEPYQGRLFVLRKAYIQPDTNQVIGTPVPKFLGRMRNIVGIEDNSKAGVTLFAEHFDSELATPSPLRWSDSDQQRLSPGDRGCEHAAENAEKTVLWPGKDAQRYGGGLAPEIWRRLAGN